jgi:hypothetical protein
MAPTELACYAGPPSPRVRRVGNPADHRERGAMSPTDPKRYHEREHVGRFSALNRGVKSGDRQCHIEPKLSGLRCCVR